MSDEMPPADGMEYPEKPGEDASASEIMMWMEEVDAYWSRRGHQKLKADDEADESDQE